MLFNKKRAGNYEVEKWLKENIKELTPYQKQSISNDEIIRFAPFDFYKDRKKVRNPLLRITIIPLFLLLTIMYVFMPVNFIITGRWGYDWDFLYKWINSVGL